jgi:hypothetical protein
MSIRSRRLIVTPLLTLGALGLLTLSAAPAIAAVPEEPVTEAAEEITGTTATLHGELNPHTSATTGYDFTYNTNGTCTEGPTTEPGAEATGEAIKVSTAVTKLEGSTEYTFCVVAFNSAGESASGLPLKFKTPTTKPVIASEAAPTVTPFDATLEAKVNPENQATKYHFEYSTSEEAVEEGKGTSFGEGSFPGVGEEQTAGPADISGGLTPHTTYYYRAVASNGTGTTEGPVESFTTKELEKPLIDSESASGVTQTEAQLHALVNPNYQETKYQFKLGTDTSYGLGPVLVSEGELGGAGFFGDLEAAVSLHPQVGVINEAIKLEPNTEYHYEAVATNATGSTEGLIAQGDQTFLTLPNPPTVSTGETSSVTATSASIAGTVNPGSSGHSAQDDTTYYFQYGPTMSYGGQAPLAPGDAGEGTSAITKEAALNGLEHGTTYHYRIVATNDNTNTPQTTYGEDQTFTTLSTPPILSGVSVSGVTQSTATITATLDPQGLPTRYELQLGSTPGLLQAEAFGNTAGVLPLTLTVGSLSPGTLYYYKLIATSLNGTSEPEGTFTTAPGPGASSPLTQPPTAPLLAIPPIAFPKEEKATTTKTLTNAQKLANALKACKKDKPKKKRVTCEKQAKKKYAPKKKATSKKTKK